MSGSVDFNNAEIKNSFIASAACDSLGYGPRERTLFGQVHNFVLTYGDEVFNLEPGQTFEQKVGLDKLSPTQRARIDQNPALEQIIYDLRSVFEMPQVRELVLQQYRTTVLPEIERTNIDELLGPLSELFS